MSAGRNLCKTLIDTAAELRRYGTLLGDFESVEARAIAERATTLARSLEALTPLVLSFEGERLPELRAGQAKDDPL